MLQVPEIRAPDEEADEDDKTSSSGPPSLSSPAISVPAVSLHVPSDDSSPAGEDPCVTLQVPCMGDMPPGRLEPPRSLHLSLPPFPQPNIPSLLQVPGFHGPRRSMVMNVHRRDTNLDILGQLADSLLWSDTTLVPLSHLHLCNRKHNTS
ncbi:uncharacterized protein LOC134782935 [Penaeus indicus]|uniref:uncharacterized protein LOC134782935 n=1 Tax=Penaeus indicus TaxID=29960 RepID=UPI00300D5256